LPERITNGFLIRSKLGCDSANDLALFFLHIGIAKNFAVKLLLIDDVLSAFITSELLLSAD